MAAADAIATVSLPWLGQRPAETYEQLCSSLLALDDAVEEVFGRVEKRCASENQKLQKLEERIASAQERARRITGSSAATVVLAAARYPAPTQQPDFERLFYDEGSSPREYGVFLLARLRLSALSPAGGKTQGSLRRHFGTRSRNPGSSAPSPKPLSMNPNRAMAPPSSSRPCHT